MISSVLTALRSNEHIRHCLFGNNFIGWEGAEAVARFIKTQTQSRIVTWYLGGNVFDAEAFTTISCALQNDVTCRALWLKRNPIGPEGSVFIKRLLRENTSIELLDYQNIALLDSGIPSIMEGLLSNRSLETLYLDANGLTLTCASPIAQYFEIMSDTGFRTGIKRIWLSMNRLGYLRASIALHSARDYIRLEGLSVGSNGCSAAVAEQVYQCLGALPNLKFIDIGMSTGYQKRGSNSCYMKESSLTIDLYIWSNSNMGQS